MKTSDERVVALKRALQKNPDNIEILHRYINTLEHLLHWEPPPAKIRVKPDDLVIQCLVCEKNIELEWPEWNRLDDIATTGFVEGVECRGIGNYGSRIWDDDGTLHFIICDECVIRHSHKMLVRDNRKNPDGKLLNARDNFESNKSNNPITSDYFKD